LASPLLPDFASTLVLPSSITLQPRIQLFEKTWRKFRDSIIGNQSKDVPGAIKNGGAMLAVSEVLLHVGSQTGTHVSVNVIGEGTKDLLASD
jgi:hypothetical protein